MSQLMTLQSAAAGQLLMRVGEPADRMLVLLRGSVHVTVRGRVLATKGVGDEMGD